MAFEHPSRFKDHPLGPTVVGYMLAERRTRRRPSTTHHPLPLAICIQFWEGDQAEALDLARLLADLEPLPRTDVALVFARRFDVPETPELRAAILHCEQKFPMLSFASERQATGHPDGCFGLWAGTVDHMFREWSEGRSPWQHVFTAEADGAPMRWDWIDRLKAAHARTLAENRSVTGPRCFAGLDGKAHVNGSLVMDLLCWRDRPELRTCPSGEAWDVFHGETLLREAGLWQPIYNMYGAHDLSESVYHTMGREHAWIASVKDGSSQRWARKLVTPEMP